MAFSDRYNFNIGDRVKDRQTGEEGRVIDLARLADGALLLTVATFVGLVIRKKSQLVIKQGQTTGIKFEKLMSAATKSEKVTAPSRITSVSQSAVQAATRNRSTDPDELTKFLDSIKGRTFHGKHQTIIERARKAYNPVLHDETLKQLTAIQNEVLQIQGELSRRPGMWSRSTTNFTGAPHPDPEIQSLLFRKSQLIRQAKTIKKSLTDPMPIPTAERRNVINAFGTDFIATRLGVNPILFAAAPEAHLQTFRFLEFGPLKVVGEAGGRSRTAVRLFDTTMPEDIEGWAESVYGQLSRIKVAEDLVRRRQQQIDVSLDWLVNPGRRGPDKQWSGGYLRDVILRGGKTVRPQDIAKEEALAQMLSRITITDEFLKKNVYRLPFNVGKRGNALELLQDMKSSLQDLSYSQRSEVWRTRFAPVLVEAVRTGGTYTRATRNLTRLQRLRLDLLGQINAFSNDPLFERLNPFLNVSESVEDPARIFSQVGTIIDPFYGMERGGVNVDIGEVWRNIREGRRSAIGLRQVSEVQIEDVRNRLRGINTRITPHNIFTEAGREGLLGTRQKPVNSFVEIGGVPFRIKDVLLEASENESRQIILQATARNRELFAPLKFFGDEPLWNVIDQIATSRTRLPEIQGPASMPLNIALRGGLAGATDDIVNVPTNLVYQFLSGQNVNMSAQELSRLGFRTQAEFTEQLGFMRGQMTRALRETMPLERLRSLAPKIVEETEFLQEAWQFLPDIIRQSQQGQYIHDIRTAAAKGAWERVEERFRQLGRDFSEAERNLVDIFFRDEEGNLVLREATQGMEFARGRNFRELATHTQFLTTTEFTSKILAFEKRMLSDARTVAMQAVAGRSRATTAAEDLYTAFERTFGRIGPEEVQRNIAEELELTVRAWRRGGAAEDVAMYNQELRDLAAQMNIELVTESPELRAAGTRWRAARRRVRVLEKGLLSNPSLATDLELARSEVREAARVYGGMKSDEVAAFQATTISKRILSGEAGTLSRGVGWARDFAALTPENQKQASQIFNDLIALAEQEGLEGRLKPIQGAFHPMAGGKFGIVLHGGPGGQGRFIYRPLNIEGTPGGFAFAEGNPANVTLFGHDPNLQLGISQIEDLIRQRAWRHVPASEARVLERNIIRSAIDVTLDVENRQLPIFRGPAGQGVGVYAGKDVTIQTIAENTRRIFQGGEFLTVDIETSMDKARVHNISVARNLGAAGGFAEGAELDLATPAFWESLGTAEGRQQAALIRQQLAAGRPLSEELRTIVKNGQAVVISEVVATEQEMLSRAAGFMAAHPDIPIVGHNVGFDVGILAERFQRPEMRQRMADTLLAAQIAHPEAKSFGLEALHRQFGGVGSEWKEAHVARPDRLVMLERIRDMAMRGGVAEGLSNVEAMTISEGQLLWDKSRRGGRAYRFEGIIDPEKARAAFEAQTGGKSPVGFGIAMRPIDFLTGEAGDLEVNYEYTPQRFARRFVANFDIVNQETAFSNMNATVEDLSRRRIRRITGNEKNTFGRLLMERERYALAQRMSEDPTAAMAELSTRYIAASTEDEKRAAGMLQRWAQKYLPDSRIRAQLARHGEFWGREMSQHEPVVSWLESQLGQGIVNRQQAGDIWQSYMSRTRELTDWNRITQEIPEAERKLAFNIEALGANPRALRIATQEALREDLAGLTRDIAARMARQNPFELNRIFQNLGVEDTSETFAALRAGRSVGDALPEGVQRYLFQTGVMPDLLNAEFDVAGTRTKLNLTARTMDDIVQEIVERGQGLAQQVAENIPDELTARIFDPTALTQLQKEFMGQSAVDLAAGLDNEGIFRFLPRHRVGEEFINRSVRDVVTEAVGLAEEDQQDVIWRLRKAAQVMSREERAKLTGILTETKPSWIQTILYGPTGRAIEAQVNAEAISDLNVAAAATRTFKPGMLNTAGMEAAEAISKHAGTFRRAGLLLGVGAGIWAAYSAIIPPQGPTQEENTPQREGFGSSEEQMQRRDEVVEEKQTRSRMTVKISGIDPGGIKHDELINSVHEAMGTFFGREIRHNAETTDRRSKIDSSYLDKLASRLIRGQGT